jgi:flagellar protein FliS
MTQATMSRAAAAYREVQVSSRSPLELVVMLYDGLLAGLVQVREATARRDLVAKRQALSKAFAILHELQNTLDMDHGREIAANLDRLYSYVSFRLTEANIALDPGPVDECIRLLSTLRDAWAQVAAAPVARAG